MGRKFIKGNLYYYESRREGRKVRSVYQGSGEFTILAYQLNAHQKRARAEEKNRRSELLADQQAADAVFDRVEVAFRAAMEGAGYRRLNRGPWRRKRLMATAIGADKPARVPLTRPERNDLANRLEAGDKTAAAPFRAWLRNEGAFLLDDFGGPQRKAEEAAIKKSAQGNCLVALVVTEQLDCLRRELYGPDPSPLEKLLADRVVFCWFTLNVLERNVASPPEDGRTYRAAEYLDRCVSHAHRRFLSAVRTLAVVKRVSASAVLSMSRTVTESVTLAESEGPR